MASAFVTAGPLGPLDLLRVADYEIRISAADAVSRPILPVPDGTIRWQRQPCAIVQTEIFLEIARRVHQRLIDQLDLRRRDVASMTDIDLREASRAACSKRALRQSACHRTAPHRRCSNS